MPPRGAAPVLLALVALAGGAAALADPLTCSGTCVVTASTTQGYDPLVAILRSGSVLEWRSIEGGHASVGGGCLHPEINYNTEGLVEDVRFDIVGAQLVATTFDPDFGEPRACTSAFRLPDGSFSMGYSCPFHSHMNGRIVVRP